MNNYPIIQLTNLGVPLKNGSLSIVLWFSFKSCVRFAFSVKKDFITPRQTRKSSRIETPVSENTQAKLDYDSLETTPGPVNGFEEKSNLPVPNSSETDKDFDSLGRTPVTERFFSFWKILQNINQYPKNLHHTLTSYFRPFMQSSCAVRVEFR